MDQAILGIDLFWSFIALAGIGVASWAVIDSYIDRDVLRAAPDYIHDGPRETIVKINLRSARASLLLHTFFLVLGIFALTASSHARPDLFYFGLAAGYITVALVNVRAVGLNQLDRLRLRQG